MAITMNRNNSHNNSAMNGAPIIDAVVKDELEVIPYDMCSKRSYKNDHIHMRD